MWLLRVYSIPPSRMLVKMFNSVSIVSPFITDTNYIDCWTWSFEPNGLPSHLSCISYFWTVHKLLLLSCDGNNLEQNIQHLPNLTSCLKKIKFRLFNLLSILRLSLESSCFPQRLIGVYFSCLNLLWVSRNLWGSGGWERLRPKVKGLKPNPAKYGFVPVPSQIYL